MLTEMEKTMNRVRKEREEELSFRHAKFEIFIEETTSKQLDI